MADLELAPLEPAEAVRFFRDKGYRIGFDWRDTSADQHVSYFTVAKAMSLDLLSDVRGAVDEALAQGGTFAEFSDRLTPTLQAKGWWGQQIMTDPASGEEKLVQLGSPRRLQIIYDTNIRMAMSAGRWERIERLKERRPYLRYVAVLDERTRDEHRAHHGVVLPVDHPFWDVYYPPNGWRCRCTVQQLSERDLKRFGYEVSVDPVIATRPWRNKRTGETRRIPEGIDPGFDHNVGKLNLRHQAARRLAEATVEAPPAVAAGILADRRTLPDLTAEFGQWVDQVRADIARPRGERRVVGTFSPAVLEALEARRGAPQTGAITIDDGQIAHARRERKGETPKGDIRLTIDEMKRIPEVIASPQAVLFDRRDGALLYVFPIEGGAGKLVIRVNYRAKERDRQTGERRTITTNAIVTGSRVPIDPLRNPTFYEVVEGEL